ncbi:MAG: sugar phosphate isomerase/epimerase family protein [Sphingorhabdus sp.]
MTIDRRELIFAGSAALLVSGCSPAIQSASQVTDTTLQRRVLWAANVRIKSLADRLVAARAGNFTHMSVFPIDWQGWRDSGLSVATMRAMIRDAGVKVLAIDPFVQWIPGFVLPDSYPPQNRGFIQFDESAILRIAEEAQAEAINCVEGLGQAHPQELLVDAFGSFADRAAQRGLRVTLEFMPISSITGLREGWTIVEAANRTNAGLCFDTWHYFRSYEDAETLARIPANKIFEVQLADATRRQQVPDMIEDLLRFRLLPGDGEFDIAGITAALKAKGAWASVGPEVFADWIDPLAPREVGERCSAALHRFM